VLAARELVQVIEAAAANRLQGLRDAELIRLDLRKEILA